MSRKDDSGPAFPIHPEMPGMLGCINSYTDAGMSLRDYFAAKALQGLLSNPKLEKQIIANGQKWVEASAYAFADAMLKARDGRF